MPRQARIVLPDVPYHVTQRGTNRQPVFLEDRDYGVYLDLMEAQLEAACVSVYAYCLMPNHVHWVVRPERADSLALLFSRVHGRYAQYLNWRSGRSGHLWQGRYYSCPMSGSHLRTALQYVEWNPVRCALTAQAVDYPYSSARSHVEGRSMDQRRILDWEFWDSFGGSLAWIGLIESPIDERKLKKLRRCTHGGIPFGEVAFEQEVEALSGRRWRKIKE